jgi:hypothetical protein
MRHALALLAACFAWLAALPALAASGLPGPAGEMQEIFRISGLEAQLGTLDQVVAASLAPNLQGVPPAQAQVVQRAVLSEFNAPLLKQQVESRLAKVHHPAHAAATLRWLRSPLARRITALEVAASSAESVREIERFAQNLPAQPPTPARVGLAREFDRATGWTEFALDVSLASARAAMTAIAAVRPDEPRLQPQQIEQAIASQRELMRNGIEQASLVSALFVYRSLSDTEFEAYIAWTKTDAGRWYHGVVREALLEVLTEVAGRMGRTVAAALRAAPAPVPAAPAAR